MKNTKLEKKYYNLYINGEWVKPENDDYYEVENPTNAEIIGYAANASEKQVQYALESSEKAQLSWEKLSIFDRCKYIEKLIELTKINKERLAKLLVLEQGKTYKDALGEVDDTVNYMQYAVNAAVHIKGDLLPGMQANNSLIIKKVPYGVTAGLCAWNYPLALVGRKLGPALVTGNTMIIKPHEITPITTTEFFKLIDEAKIPAGVANLITGKGIASGNQIVSSPITKLISVTGSVGAGQSIYKAASQNISGLTLELGGKAPFIVLDDADMDKAVEAAVVSRYANCGQVCICCDMVYVQENIAEEFTSKLIEKVKKIKVGDPFDENTDMGPKVCESDRNKIDSIIKRTAAQGAKIALGGKVPEGKEFEKGWWYEPTVLTDVTPDMVAAQEEIFGPVLPIIKIKNLDEAISITNALPYGLASYIFTNDIRKMIRAVNELQVGTVFVNKAIDGYNHGYHSGHKLSGTGGEDGEYGIENFLQKRTIYFEI